MFKTKETRKLTFLYLANDVIQNSKKKGPEFGTEFGTVLLKAFEHMAEVGLDEKTKGSIVRLLDIWLQREIYSERQISEFKKSLSVKIKDTAEPHAKKSKLDVAVIKSSKERKKRPENAVSVLEVDGKVETHIHLSPRTPAGDPPEPEELINAIINLENNAASADEVVREKIAKLPAEVSEVSYLAKLQDKVSAEELSAKVDAAVELLNNYNDRLNTEMENRKKVAAMLKDFLIAQRELLAQAEKGLEEYQEKLQKVYAVRKELKSHIQNLPDLSTLPDVTGGLAPLPSAGDLFNLS